MLIKIIKTMEFCSSNAYSLERSINDGPTDKMNTFLKNDLYYFLPCWSDVPILLIYYKTKYTKFCYSQLVPFGHLLNITTIMHLYSIAGPMSYIVRGI